MEIDLLEAEPSWFSEKFHCLASQVDEVGISSVVSLACMKILSGPPPDTFSIQQREGRERENPMAQVKI